MDCSKICLTHLKTILSCMPLLTRLNLTGQFGSLNPLFDGLFLAEFISDKLPQLEKFTFQFKTSRIRYEDLYSIIMTFRTPF